MPVAAVFRPPAPHPRSPLPPSGNRLKSEEAVSTTEHNYTPDRWGGRDGGLGAGSFHEHMTSWLKRVAV